MIVVDASVTAPMILPDEAQQLLSTVERAFEGGEVTVPQHWQLEVLNLGLMASRRGRIDLESLWEGLDALAAYEVRVDRETGGRAWFQTRHLASKYRLTAYDAAYLELALRTGLALATFDTDLIDAAIAEGVALVL